jgi:hypothetical protein
MSKICDRVYDRLKQLKAEPGPLTEDYFAGLGEVEEIHRCLEDFERHGLVKHEFDPAYVAIYGKRRMIRFWLYLTDEGREEFETD